MRRLWCRLFGHVWSPWCPGHDGPIDVFHLDRGFYWIRFCQRCPEEEKVA